MERAKLVTFTCVMCNNNFSVRVNHDDYIAWSTGGKLIQDAFPYLTVAERELFLSQTCGVCFDNLFEYLDEEDIDEQNQ